MRKVADALEVEAMSLYNHVANKAAMLDGVVEVVLSDLAPPKRTSSWTGAVRDRARALRDVLRAHPNALPLFGARPAVTPASLVHVEQSLAILREAGFTAVDALASFQVLVAFVVGHTMASYAPAPDARPAYDLLDAADFPRVTEAAALERDVEKEFELGLSALLTGLEPRSGRKARKDRGRP